MFLARYSIDVSSLFINKRVPRGYNALILSYFVKAMWRSDAMASIARLSSRGS